MVERGINAARVAERTGMSTGAISNLIRGKKGADEEVAIGLETLGRISRGLGIPPTKLLEEDAPEVNDEDIPTGRARRTSRRPAERARAGPEPSIQTAAHGQGSTRKRGAG